MRTLRLILIATTLVSSLAFADNTAPVNLESRETASTGQEDFQKKYLEQISTEKQMEDARTEQARIRTEKFLDRLK